MKCCIESSQTEPSENQDYIWKGSYILNTYLRTKTTANSAWGLDDQIRLFQKVGMLKDFCLYRSRTGWSKFGQSICCPYSTFHRLSWTCCAWCSRKHTSRSSAPSSFCYNNKTVNSWRVVIPSVNREQGKESCDFEKRVQNCSWEEFQNSHFQHSAKSHQIPIQKHVV